MADEKAFGELLIEGLEEAVAYDRGELRDVQVRRVPRTARNTEITPPPRYDASAIARIRKGLNVSQSVFAEMLNVSRSTVQAWEQGTRKPEGPTRRLLEVAEKHPETIAIESPSRFKGSRHPHDKKPGSERLQSNGSISGSKTQRSAKAEGK
jgi:putative transcriptional regulator